MAACREVLRRLLLVEGDEAEGHLPVPKIIYRPEVLLDVIVDLLLGEIKMIPVL